MGREVLVVSREALRLLSEAAFMDINHLLRPGHLASLKRSSRTPRPPTTNKFVAFDFLKNANIAAGGVLADVPGHRHRDHHGQEGPTGVHRGRG